MACWLPKTERPCRVRERKPRIGLSSDNGGVTRQSVPNSNLLFVHLCAFALHWRKDTKAMSNGWIMDNKEDSNGNSERVELFCCPWTWIQNCLLQHCGVCPTSCYDTTITQAGQLLLQKSKTKTLKGALWSYKIATLWPRPRPKSNHWDAQQRSSSDKMFTLIKWKTEEN